MKASIPSRPDRASHVLHTPDPIVEAVESGYAFEGASLELGALMLDATELTDTHVRIPWRC